MQQHKIYHPILIIILLLLSSPVFAQTSWNRIHNFCDDGLTGSNNLASFADDDVIMIAGHTQSHGFANLRCYIATLDYNGNVISKRNIYGPGNINMLMGGYAERVANPLAKVATDKYVITGAAWDNTANTRIPVYQPFLFFFNKNCDSLKMVKWTDTIVSRVPFSIISDNSGIVIAGMESSRGIHWDATQSDYQWDSCYIWLAKFDHDGNQLWSKHITINKNQYSNKYYGWPSAFRIVKSADGLSYIISGPAYNKDKATFDGLIAKTDLDGNLIWSRFLPWKYAPGGYFDITALKNGGYGFCSSYAEAPPTSFVNSFVYYGKLDENGDTLWTKHFRKDTLISDGYNIVEAENEDLIIHLKYYYHYYRSAAFRTTPKGNIKWYREYSYRDTHTYLNQMFNLTYTPSKQILLTGQFSADKIPGFFDSSGLYSWFVLTDTFGCIEPGCQVGDTTWWLTDVNEIAAKPVELSIYPNPATNIVYVQADNTSTKLKAVMRDMSGRTLSTTPLHSNSKTPIDIADLPQGLYMLEVWDEVGKVKVFKVMK